MSKYIYSTLTGAQVYRDKDGNKVRIEGGANSPSKHMMTPRGIATKVTDDQLKVLENCNLFKAHKQNGFIEVSAFEKNADKVAKDLKSNDKSAPDTEEKLKAEGKETPTTGKK